MITDAVLWEPLSVVEYEVSLVEKDDNMLEQMEASIVKDRLWSSRLEDEKGLKGALLALLREEYSNQPMPYKFQWDQRFREIRLAVWNRSVFALHQKERFKNRAALISAGPSKTEASQQIDRELVLALYYLKPLETRCEETAKLAKKLRAASSSKISLEEVSPVIVEFPVALSVFDREKG